MHFKVNPNMFFFVQKKGIITWDFSNHKQYILEKKVFDVLLEILQSGNSCDHETLIKLREANLIGDFEEPKWGWDTLSRIFHVGTSDLPENFKTDPDSFIQEYIESCKNKIETTNLNCYEPDGEKISLPSPNFNFLKDKKLLDVLLKRRTSRSFNGQKIELDIISTILYVTFSNQKREQYQEEKNGLKILGMKKTSPSAGSMHPSECYLISFNINDLEPGIYHYSSNEHRLTVVRKGSYSQEISSLLRGHYFASKLTFGIFITSRFHVLWQKYHHSRAYRAALMDVGHLSQTFQLCATSLDLLTWLTGALQDTKVSELLNLCETEKPILFIGIGKGNSSPFPENC